jgi:WhiB family transcriptional regulator, redox-sensing transcriptional regulator
MPNVELIQILDQKDRNCLGIDPDLFVTEDPHLVRQTKRVCSGCPAKELCFEYAVERPALFGVWGGSSYRERHAYRVTRNLKGAKDAA